MKTSNILLYISFLALVAGRAQAQMAKLVLPIGHTADVYAANFSPDGRYVATASDDRSVRIYETATGKEILTFPSSTYAMFFAEFSSDGKYLATPANEKSVQVFDLEKGRVTHQLEGEHWNLIISAEFSSDGLYLLMGSLDGSASLCEVASGKLIQRYEGHGADHCEAHFSPNGKYVVTASADSTSRIFETLTGKSVHTLLGHRAAVTKACFSPDGRYIATASWDSTACLFDAKEGTLRVRLEGHQDELRDVQFSPDGKYVVTASADKTALVFEVPSGELRFALAAHSGALSTARFSPDGKFILTTSADGTVGVFNAHDGSLSTKLQGHSDFVYDARFNSTGTLLVTASADKTARIFDWETGKTLHVLEGKTQMAWAAQFSPNGNAFVLPLPNNTAVVVESQTGKTLQELKGHADQVLSAQWNSDGSRIATSSIDSTALIFEAATGKLLCRLEKHPEIVYQAVFSPDDKLIATADLDGLVRIFDSTTGKLLRLLKGHTQGVQSVAFSPDGKQLVTASYDKTVLVFEVASGKKRRALAHEDLVASARFSTDGNFIISNDLSGITRVFQASNGKRLYQLNSPSNTVHSAQFSSDGKYILTADGDGNARLYETSSQKMVRTFVTFGTSLHHADFSPDGNHIITTGFDHRTILWDAKTGKPLYTRLQLRNGDWLVYDPYNRYDGTPTAREALHFACGLEVVDLAQVKDALYVPNLVQRIWSGENLDHLPKLNNLQICGVAPRVDPQTPKNDGGFYYKITPGTGGVGDVEIYINGVLRQTLLANDLPKKLNAYELQIPPALLAQYQEQGQETAIKVIAKTADNRINSRGPISKTVIPAEQTYRKPHLYAVFVGIDDYKGTGLDLNYATKDALDLQKALELSARKFFNADDTNRVHLQTLTVDSRGTITGKTPDRNNILQALQAIEKESKVEDVLLIFFAGHGEIHKEKQLLLLTADASKDQAPDYQGISMKELLEKLAKIPAGKRILLLDACHSGAAINALDMQHVAGTRNTEAAEQETQRLKALENLASKSGLAIITASSSDQKALELPQYEHGLMTYALLTTMLHEPAVLDAEQHLQLEDWLRETERTVAKLGEIQSAQRFVPLNFSIGKIDEEVRNSVDLKEIPAILIANVLNRNTDDDDLDIKALLKKQLSATATRSGSEKIIVVEKESATAVSVNITYEVVGNKIESRITLKRNKVVVKQFTYSGSDADKEGFVRGLEGEILKAARE